MAHIKVLWQYYCSSILYFIVLSVIACTPIKLSFIHLCEFRGLLMVILLDNDYEYFMPLAYRSIEDSQKFHFQSFVLQPNRFVIWFALSFMIYDLFKEKVIKIHAAAMQIFNTLFFVMWCSPLGGSKKSEM